MIRANKMYQLSAKMYKKIALKLHLFVLIRFFLQSDKSFSIWLFTQQLKATTSLLEVWNDGIEQSQQKVDDRIILFCWS